MVHGGRPTTRGLAWVAGLLLGCGPSATEPGTDVIPGAAQSDAGTHTPGAVTIEPPEAPQLAPCLGGPAPEGCAQPPALPVLESWTCPTGWDAVPGFTDAEGNENTPEGLAPFTACAPPDRAACAGSTFQRTGDVTCQPLGSPCPSGNWPEDIPDGASVVFVASGATGGDGTQQTPFGTIAEAVAHAEDGDVLAIAKGTYEEHVRVDKQLTLWGACAADVTIVGPGPDSSEDPNQPSTLVGVVDVRDGGEAELRNLTVSGERIGLRVYGDGTLRSEGVHVRGVRRSAVHASGGVVELRDTLLSGTREALDASGGHALLATSGAKVTLQGVVARDNQYVGLLALSSGTQVTLHDVVIADTASSDSDGMFGRGLNASEGVSLTAERLIVERSGEFGLTCSGCELVVEDAVVRDTQGRLSDQKFGEGVIVFDAGQATFRRVVFAGNRDHGVLAHPFGVPPSVTLQDVIIRDTRPRGSDDRFGRGLAAQDGSTVQGTRVLVERSHDVGVVSTTATGESSLTLQDAVVRDTRSTVYDPSKPTSGWGVLVENASKATLSRCLIESNRDFGVYAGATSMAAGPSVVMQDVRVRATQPREHDGENGGGLIVFDGAVVRVERGRFEANHDMGVMAYSREGGPRSVLELVDVRVQGTRPEQGDETTGIGLIALNAADLKVTRAEVVDNYSGGIIAYRSKGTETPVVVLQDVLIQQTKPQLSDGLLGVGFGVFDGAKGEAKGLVVERSQGFGVLLTDDMQDVRTELDLEDVVVRDTDSNGVKQFGRGVGVQAGGRLSVLRGLLERNRELGAAAFESGTELILRDVRIADTRRARCGELPVSDPESCVESEAPWGARFGGGMGVGAYLQGHLVLERFEISGSAMCGMQVSRDGTAEASFGTVHHNTVGLNVQTEGFDVTRVMNGTVRWHDNDRPLDTTDLSVPVATPPMPDW